MIGDDRTLARVLHDAGVSLWNYDHTADAFAQTVPACARPAGDPDGPRTLTLTEWLRTVHPDDRPALAQAIAGTAGKLPIAVECRLRGDDGWRWVYLRGAPLERDAAGQPLYSAGTLMDIPPPRHADHPAERQHHLEQLVLASRMDLAQARLQAESGSRIKSSFLANMSHELRTPMNAIIGFAHLARRSATEPDQRGYLSKITDAAEHLLQIINDLLDVSNIEAGRLVLERADFQLFEVLERTWNVVGDQADAKGLEMTTAIDPKLAVPVRGDAQRLGQILINLVTNAIKFTERGGVAMRARLDEGGADWLRVRFEVADTGIGIAAEDRQNLFQPFTQADDSTARRYGGTGLGLTISAELVRLMGGEIGVDSVPGQGSTFWFTVRLDRGGARKPRADESTWPTAPDRPPPVARATAPAPVAVSGRTTAPAAGKTQENADGELARQLAAIDGLDLTQGLRSFRGRIAPYQRLLGQFVGAHQRDMSVLLDCLEGDNLVEARRVAHTLKGSAAALGAARIQNLAAQLEAAIRDLIDDQSAGKSAAALARPKLLARTLDDELADFARAVAGTVSADAVPACGAAAAERQAIDWPTLRAALERLRALLAEDDMQASDVLAGVAPTLRAALGAEIEPLLRAVEAFDFPAALATLRELRAAHAELAGKP